MRPSVKHLLFLPTILAMCLLFTGCSANPSHLQDRLPEREALEDEKAFDQYDQIKEMQVRRNLGKEYAEKGMTAEAIAIYEKLVVDYADYGHNWLELADLYEEVMNDEKELWALNGFLDNTKLENTGWPGYIPDINARIFSLTGDAPRQIRNLLEGYPNSNSTDRRLTKLDLAEAIYSEGYLNDAFFHVYIVLSQLDFAYPELNDTEQQLYVRATALHDKYVKEFWPEFDASKALVSQPYPGPYADAKNMQQSDGIQIHNKAEEYRRLDEYPSLIEVQEYCNMILVMYSGYIEIILEAKLMELIVSEAVDETGYGYGESARSGFRNWGDKYEQHLKEKLEVLYRIPE